MAETIDIIHKLMALAMNNPNEEEARSAAYRAVAMLTEHEIPIGGKTTAAKTPAMTPEEQTEFKDILAGLARRDNPDEFRPASYYTTTEIDDEFMKKRIIAAWRQIREMRAQLTSEIQRYERETHRKFGQGF
jgi:protein required for attachment to host cells